MFGPGRYSRSLYSAALASAAATWSVYPAVSAPLGVLAGDLRPGGQARRPRRGWTGRSCAATARSRSSTAAPCLRRGRAPAAAAGRSRDRCEHGASARIIAVSARKSCAASNRALGRRELADTDPSRPVIPESASSTPWWCRLRLWSRCGRCRTACRWRAADRRSARPWRPRRRARLVSVLAFAAPSGLLQATETDAWRGKSLAATDLTDVVRRARICSRPALVSAATSASAYGVKSIGSVTVEARSSDSHCAAVTPPPVSPVRAGGAAADGVLAGHHVDVRQQRRVDRPGQVVLRRPLLADVEQRAEPAPGGKAAGQRVRSQRRPAHPLLRGDERPDPCHVQRQRFQGRRSPASKAAGCGRWRAARRRGSPSAPPAGIRRTGNSRPTPR